jgi:mono/diheme cytochrome c family protein
MTDRLKQPPRQREYGDPEERTQPLPRILLVLAAAVTAWGAWYITTLDGTADATLGDRRTISALAPAVPTAGAVNGGQIFAGKCAACHQATGLGVAGVFPPLAGSPWVLESETRVTQILLHGIQGPLDVLGTTYNGLMPPWKALSDDEIAAVATYIRSQWGNTASPVSAATVAEQRAATRDRTTPWSGGTELLTVP